MVRVARMAIAGCGLLTLAACSAAAGSAVDTTTPSTTAPTSSTTLAPSTTSAPTTTLSPQQQDEAEIRALHDRFFEMIVTTGNPPDPDHPGIAATTTGIQRERWAQFLHRMRDLGEHNDGEVSGEILAIDYIDADHVAVRDCTTAITSRFSADGHVVAEDAGPPLVSEIRMVRTAEGWRVEDWFTGGAQPCGE
ncbi:MAG TPA: hypothetical protein VFP08_00660 [Acidimicrobiales bacterium]|nr:hypothetical protein [Acidimicrobiales bacterium]